METFKLKAQFSLIKICTDSTEYTMHMHLYALKVHIKTKAKIAWTEHRLTQAVFPETIHATTFLQNVDISEFMLNFVNT